MTQDFDSEGALHIYVLLFYIIEAPVQLLPFLAHLS
jgi:hypothetical protein